MLVHEVFGVNAANELNVHFTREDIANVAGTTAEQVVRQITDFEEDGFITKSGRKIVLLDLVGLRKIIYDHNPHFILE